MKVRLCKEKVLIWLLLGNLADPSWKLHYLIVTKYISRILSMARRNYNRLIIALLWKQKHFDHLCGPKYIQNILWLSKSNRFFACQQQPLLLFVHFCHVNATLLLKQWCTEEITKLCLCIISFIWHFHFENFRNPYNQNPSQFGHYTIVRRELVIWKLWETNKFLKPSIKQTCLCTISQRYFIICFYARSKCGPVNKWAFKKEDTFFNFSNHFSYHCTRYVVRKDLPTRYAIQATMTKGSKVDIKWKVDTYLHK